MPVGVVTNEEEEHKWERAKQIAADEGHEKDWQYIMGIYKRMNPKRFKVAAVLLKAALYKQADDTLSMPVVNVKRTPRKSIFEGSGVTPPPFQVRDPNAASKPFTNVPIPQSTFNNPNTPITRRPAAQPRPAQQAKPQQPQSTWTPTFGTGGSQFQDLGMSDTLAGAHAKYGPGAPQARPQVAKFNGYTFNGNPQQQWDAAVAKAKLVQRNYARLTPAQRQQEAANYQARMQWFKNYFNDNRQATIDFMKQQRLRNDPNYVAGPLPQQQASPRSISTTTQQQPPLRPQFRSRTAPQQTVQYPTASSATYGAPSRAPVLGYSNGTYRQGSSGINNFYEDNFQSSRSYGTPGSGNGLATAFSDDVGANNIAMADIRRREADEAARRQMIADSKKWKNPLRNRGVPIETSRGIINYSAGATPEQQQAAQAEWNRIYQARANTYAPQSQIASWRAAGRPEDEIRAFVNKHVMGTMERDGFKRPDMKGTYGTPLAPSTGPSPSAVAGGAR